MRQTAQVRFYYHSNVTVKVEVDSEATEDDVIKLAREKLADEQEEFTAQLEENLVEECQPDIIDSEEEQT